MKRLLMLSASIFEIPLIRAAQTLGFYVITTGNNEKAPGHRVSDEYAPFDYSDYDGMVRLAQKYRIDAISQGCSDNCALVASYIGEKLGLKGHDSFENAKIIHRKYEFKKYVKKSGIKSPIAEYFDQIDEAMKYDATNLFPVIVKPSDQAGGKGVSVVYNTEDYVNAIKKAFDISISKKIVIEPYIDGSLHSLSTFIVNKKAISYITLNDYSYANKYLTNTGVAPADNHFEAVKALIPEVNRIAEDLNLVDGLLHLQYIERNGEFWIIEMMRRMPGNNYTTAAARSSGVDWRDWIIKAEAGLDCSGIPAARLSDKLYGYHAVMSAKNGIYDGYDISDKIRERIIDIEEYDEPGTEINNYLYQKFALVQFYFNNVEEKNDLIRKMDTLIHCKVI